MNVIDINQNVHNYLVCQLASERSHQESIVIEQGNLIEGIVIKWKETCVFFKLKASKLIGCLHITDCGKDINVFNTLAIGESKTLYIKWISEETNYKIVDLSLSNTLVNETLPIKGNKMRAVIWRFNKYSSYPLLVEAGWEMTGSVFFSDLNGSDKYQVGDFIDVCFDETVEERHYFKINKTSSGKPKVGDKIYCWFVSFWNGFGATVQLDKNLYGFIDITEITDDIEPRVD